VSAEPRRYSDAELEAAVAALADPDRFREAEALVARAAPHLGRILAEALAEGGWFAESHADEVRKATEHPDPEARLVAIRTLLAEETRMGMLVGVAIGWALATELSSDEQEMEEE
jgi:hypothetical protein